VARNDFLSKTNELAAMVGDGDLVGTFMVNGGERTVPLEVGYWKTGPLAGVRMEDFTTPGTGPHAVQNSLEATWANSLADIARTTLTEGPQEGMKRHVERMDAQFKRVTGDYANSTARVVTDNGVPVHEKFGAHFGKEPGE
jgi:hypothetical protein